MPKVFAGIKHKRKLAAVKDLDTMVSRSSTHLPEETLVVLEQYYPAIASDIAQAATRLTELKEESARLWAVISEHRTTVDRCFRSSPITPENIDERLPNLEGFTVNNIEWNRDYQNAVSIKGSLKINSKYPELLELLELKIHNEWGIWIETILNDYRYPEATKTTLRNIYNLYTPLREQGFDVDVRVRSVSTKNVNLTISIKDHKNHNHKESL